MVGHGDHGAIGGFVEAAEPVLPGFCSNQLHFLFKGGIPVYVHSDQTVFLLFYYADLG